MEKKNAAERLVRWCSDFKKQLPLQMMVLPGILFMIVFNYIPIYGLSIAFKNYTVISTLKSAKWVFLDNFKIILTDKYFWDAVKNTLGISFLKLAAGFVVPIILAVMIYSVKDGPFKRITQTISYLPHFLSWIVLGGMLISWLSTSCQRQPENVDFRRNGMSFFGGQHSGVYSPYTPLYLPA